MHRTPGGDRERKRYKLKVTKRPAGQIVSFTINEHENEWVDDVVKYKETHKKPEIDLEKEKAEDPD